MLIRHMDNPQEKIHDIRITGLEQRTEQKHQKNFSMA